ncbi:hypothetical protein PLICRDRAFT_386013 [Plicaturopsis crispa FD-325 SS-3]|nr:hypothetical protein PLICRDRAFT_386013 [Plicaturopsis crispa FD-325 SS-3]
MPSYVVVGASRGIGLGFVQQLSASPENEVFAIVRSTGTSPKLLSLAAEKKNIHVLQADVGDSQALKVAADAVSLKTGGTLDVLINNAALIDRDRAHLSLDEYPEDFLEQDLQSSFDINVIGVIRSINAFLPLLKKGATKKVITLTSARGVVDFTLEVGLPDAGPYSISKAALNMANAKYAARFRDEGFVFLAISPGSVDTTDGAKLQQKSAVASTVMAKVLAVNPNFAGPQTVEESVGLMLKLVDAATGADNGKIISHHGDNNWL